MRHSLQFLLLGFLTLLLGACAGTPVRGTGDLGLVIERASGHVTLVNTSSRSAYARIGGRPGTPMPPWHRFLAEDEAQWIVAKLMTGFPQ